MINSLAPDNFLRFSGMCRYRRYGDGKDYRDWIKVFTVTNTLECQRHCIDNTGCTAFSYQNHINKRYVENCNLYEGGPYTYGNGQADTTCYIIKGKPGYFYYNI